MIRPLSTYFSAISSIVPVSYTHLDVYKRQTLYRSVYDGANVWTPEQYPSAWEVAA